MCESESLPLFRSIQNTYHAITLSDNIPTNPGHVVTQLPQYVQNMNLENLASHVLRYRVLY